MLAVGAPLAPAERAVVALTGRPAQLTTKRQWLRGVQATTVVIDIEGLRPLEPAQLLKVPPTLHGGRRRRSPQFARAARPSPTLDSIHAATAPAPDQPLVRPAPKRARRSLTRHRLAIAPAIGGEAVSPAEVAVWLRQAELDPTVKALAMRAGSLWMEAFGRAAGNVDQALLEGHHVVNAMAQVVAACAMIDALSPTLLTSTPIGVRAGLRTDAAMFSDVSLRDGPLPRAWLEHVLLGGWLCERDDAGPSDVTGAALVRALASRVGGRGWFRNVAIGVGASTLTSQPLLMSAMLGQAEQVTTRQGDRTAGAVVLVDAQVDPGADKAALAATLFTAGAEATSAVAATDLRGHDHLRLHAAVPPRQLDAVVRALWRAGAEHVHTAWGECRDAPVEEVTVPVGRGRTRRPVRVRAVRDEDGTVLSLRCGADDVREAARVGRRPEEMVRADALAVWQQLMHARDDLSRSDDDGATLGSDLGLTADDEDDSTE
jgi:uncharacterized protein (DUF111 family)